MDTLVSDIAGDLGEGSTSGLSGSEKMFGAMTTQASTQSTKEHSVKSSHTTKQVVADRLRGMGDHTSPGPAGQSQPQTPPTRRQQRLPADQVMAEFGRKIAKALMSDQKLWHYMLIAHEDLTSDMMSLRAKNLI